MMFFTFVNFIKSIHPSSYSETTCRTTAWWVLQPLPKTILQPYLDQSKEKISFDSSNPLSNLMKPDEHPVYFEFNQQNDCQQSSLPPWLANVTEQTFVEFKLEIPYLIYRNQTVMLKPLVYQNSLLDVTATRVVYGLPTYFATMSADFKNNRYSISYEQEAVKVSFQPLMPTLVPIQSPEAANFSTFIQANVSPWLAFPPLSIPPKTKCASNVYNFFQTAYVRPANMTLSIIGDIFHSIPSGIYTNTGNQPLGAWQIDISTTITSTYDCR